jgi:hypothetical protein
MERTAQKHNIDKRSISKWLKISNLPILLESHEKSRKLVPIKSKCNKEIYAVSFSNEQRESGHKVNGYNVAIALKRQFKDDHENVDIDFVRYVTF